MTTKMSWSERLERGEDWHRYWNHPRRWTPKRWAMFWLGVAIHVALAATCFAFAAGVGGWPGFGLYLEGSVFAAIALGQLVVVAMATRRPEQ